MRSSHHTWSCPQASYGASGRPLSSFGGGQPRPPIVPSEGAMPRPVSITGATTGAADVPVRVVPVRAALVLVRDDAFRRVPVERDAAFLRPVERDAVFLRPVERDAVFLRAPE